MLISINGTVINTKSIYMIENIKDLGKNGDIGIMGFIIKFFNTPYFLEITIFDKSNNSNQTLSEFRDSIVKIWQENQSEIPQFNF